MPSNLNNADGDEKDGKTDGYETMSIQVRWGDLRNLCVQFTYRVRTTLLPPFPSPFPLPLYLSSSLSPFPVSLPLPSLPPSLLSLFPFPSLLFNSLKTTFFYCLSASRPDAHSAHPCGQNLQFLGSRGTAATKQTRGTSRGSPSRRTPTAGDGESR